MLQVLILHAKSSVFNCDLNASGSVLDLDHLNLDFDVSLEGELECVACKVEQNLFQTPRFSDEHFWNIFIDMDFELESPQLGLHLEKLHDRGQQ